MEDLIKEFESISEKYMMNTLMNTFQIKEHEENKLPINYLLDCIKKMNTIKESPKEQTVQNKIKALEKRKKYSKNYLEIKNIDKEINKLKKELRSCRYRIKRN